MKMILGVSALVLAVSASAAGTNQTKQDEFGLKEREKAGIYNVALIFGNGSSLAAGIIGEATLSNTLTGGLILGFYGGFGAGVRLENGFRGAHKTGVFTALTADFDYHDGGVRYARYNYEFSCSRIEFGGKGVIGYQYLHETGINLSAGVGAGVRAFDWNQCDNVYYNTDGEADWDIDPTISTEFTIGYNFDY